MPENGVRFANDAKNSFDHRPELRKDPLKGLLAGDSGKD
jgi:hypothetical protein